MHLLRKPSVARKPYHKINAENFNAFRSYNFPSLATAGIHIKYEYDRIHKADPNLPLKPHYLYDTNVIILTLFPGIQENMISNILHTPGLRAVVLKPTVRATLRKSHGSSNF